MAQKKKPSEEFKKKAPKSKKKPATPKKEKPYTGGMYYPGKPGNRWTPPDIRREQW